MTATEKGFTLLEILVAMAVLAVVLTTVFKLQSSTVALSEAAHFKALAPVLAEQQMAGLAMATYEPDRTSGTFDAPYAGYAWECEILSGGDEADWDELLTEAQADRLKRIRLTVFGPGKSQKFTLDTWRYTDET